MESTICLEHYWNFATTLQHLNDPISPDAQCARIEAEYCQSGQCPVEGDTFRQLQELGDLIWIALKQITIQGAVLCPMWLPCRLTEDGQIVALPLLPWFNSELTHVLGKYGAPMGQRQHLEALLQDAFLDENQKVSSLNWSEYRTRALTLLNTVLKMPTEDAYYVQGLLPKQRFEGELVNLYTQMEPYSFQEQFLPGGRNDNVTFWPQVSMDADTLESLRHLMHLPRGHIQAIKTPLGTDVTGLIQHYFASCVCKAAIDESSLPHIRLVAHDHSAAKFDWQHRNAFEEIAQSDEASILAQTQAHLQSEKLPTLSQAYMQLRERLTQANYEYNSALKAANVYFDEQRESLIEEIFVQIETLQKKDERLEAVLDNVNATIIKMQQAQEKRSLVRALFGFMLKNPMTKIYESSIPKELQAKFKFETGQPLLKQLTQKARTLKVKRAKWDGQRIESIETMNALKSSEKQYQSICEKFGNHQWENLADASLSLMQTSTKSFIETALLTLKVKAFLDEKEKGEDHDAGLSVSDFMNQLTILTRSELLDEAQACDEVIICDANLWRHDEVLSVLNKAHKAIFLGDERYFHDFNITPNWDDALIRYTQLGNEAQEIEDIQFKQVLHQDSHALHRAKELSFFKKASIEGVYASAELGLSALRQFGMPMAECVKQFVAQRSDKPFNAASLAVNYQPIDGQSELQDIGMVNQAEARAIVESLSQIEDTAHYAVVASTMAQRNLIRSMLNDGSVPVLAFCELKHHQYKHLMVSTTFLGKDIKPAPFDEGLSVLYTLLCTGLHQCMIFAHPSLFNAQTHSPTGFIAKWFHHAESTLEADSV